MENLSLKIKLYLEQNSKNYNNERNNFELQDDTGNPFISSWDVSGLEKPTDEQLNAFASEATTLENNNQVIKTRKELYGSTAKQLEYIVENGVDAFVTKQRQIKTENPKS